MQSQSSGGSSLPNIRASMLPGFLDCSRKAAAQQWRERITGKGYTLRATQRSIGAAIGTALHRSAAELLRRKQESERGGFNRQDVTDARELGMIDLIEGIKSGVEWDNTAKCINDAERHLDRFLLASIPHILGLVPEQVEVKLSAPLVDPLTGEVIGEASGHIDARDLNQFIWDWKTGAREPSPQAQEGLYSLMAKRCDLPVRGIGSIWLKRGSLDKPQENPIVKIYDLVESERLAYHAAISAARMCNEFDITGDAHVFPANPRSQMCSLVYCSAHSTDFCSFGKGG